MGRVSQSMQEAAVVTNINETAENTKWPLETPRPEAPKTRTHSLFTCSRQYQYVLQTNALYLFLPLLGVVHKGHNVLSHCMYKVVHLLANLGWVDLDLECSNVLLGQ